MADRIRRLLDTSGVPFPPEIWQETAWERGRRDAAAFAGGRPLAFLLVTGPIVGAVGAVFASDDSTLVRVLVGALMGLAGCVLVVVGAEVVFAFRALRHQRDDARAHLLEAGDLKRLLYLREWLRESSKQTRSEIARLENEGRTGPVSEFDDPWIRGHNHQVRVQLQTRGFEELIPGLVIEEPKLDTWENVLLETKRSALKAQNFVGSGVFHTIEYHLPDHV